MFLYAVNPMCHPFELSVLPYLHIHSAFDVYDLSKTSTDHLESVWMQLNMMSFIIYGLDSNKFYYFLLPHLVNKNESYWRINDDHLSHDEAYALQMIKQAVQRLEDRLQTRSVLQKMIEHIQSDEEYLEKLKQLDKTNRLDGELIEHTIKEIEERIEIDRAYRPGGVGYRQAQDDFVRKIVSLESVCLV